MGVKRFQDLVAWQLASELRRAVRDVAGRREISGDFAYCNQLMRAARSVTSNIAEGFPCSHAEFARFLEISGRSLREIEDRLLEALDDRLLEPTDLQRALSLTKRTSVAVARLRNYLRQTPDPPSYKHPPLRRKQADD